MVCRGMGVRDQFAGPLASLGYVQGRLGKRPEARRHLAEALRTGLDTGGVAWLPEYLTAVAAFLATEGLDAPGDDALENKVMAVELYALASTAPSVSNSCWFHKVAGKHVAAVADTLPPQAVTAAKERGRARDLWGAAEEMLEDLSDSETNS
jgi:hypothetical protein